MKYAIRIVESYQEIETGNYRGVTRLAKNFRDMLSENKRASSEAISSMSPLCADCSYQSLYLKEELKTLYHASRRLCMTLKKLSKKEREAAIKAFVDIEKMKKEGGLDSDGQSLFEEMFFERANERPPYISEN